MHLLLSLLFALTLHTPAHAEEISSWNFLQEVAGNPINHQLTKVELTEQGLHIVTDADGYIAWEDPPIPGPTDVITIRAAAPMPTDAALLWKAKTQNGLVQLAFEIPASSTIQNINIDVGRYDEWDWQTAEFAIALPAGSEAVMQEIQFRHWNAWQKMTEGWKSFWTPDDFKPYSINFLWGPLVGLNPVARATLFDTLPPSAWSATRYMYGVLAAAIVMSIIIATTGRRSLALGILIATFGCIWIVFDLRMSVEILSYAYDDVQSFVLPAPEEKRLRTLDRFPWVMDQFVAELRDGEPYGLFIPNGTQFWGQLRYRTYPSVPVTDTTQMDDLHIWLVLERPDVFVRDDQLIWQHDGTETVLSEQGSIVQSLTSHSFIFRSS